MCRIRIIDCKFHNRIHGLQIYRCEGRAKMPREPGLTDDDIIWVRELHLTQDEGCQGLTFPFPISRVQICIVQPNSQRTVEN